MPPKKSEKHKVIAKETTDKKSVSEDKHKGNSNQIIESSNADNKDIVVNLETVTEEANEKNLAAKNEEEEAVPAAPPVVVPRLDIIEASVLKDLLECPVCLRVPRSSPIYQCARGHVVCSECKPNVSTCPQCRDVLGNIRSLVSEKVLEKLPAPCKFSDAGCQIELMKSELPSHEKECQFRSVNCVDLACRQSVSLANLLNHLDSDHETEDFVRVEGGEYSSHFIVNEKDFTEDIMWISDQLHFDEKYFYRECCRSNAGLWYIWVYVLEAGAQEHNNYTCEISVMSADRQEVLTCKSRPLSLDYTKEKVTESGRGLVFTDSTARLFWEDNKVRYSVNIKRKQ